MEIVIPAGVASADEVAAMIAEEVGAARAGTEIRGGDVVFWTRIEHSEQVLDEARGAAARMAALGMSVDPAGVVARPAVPETEWRDAWKRYFHVTRITRAITIVPSWESHQPGPDELIIRLDPGQAFGTGAHASTRLVLEDMQELCDRGAAVQSFADVGTGSGILAIAAAMLWPRSRGVAVDIDPSAVSAAAENLAGNQVGERVRCADTPAADIPGAFDLVLANIQAHVLYDLADAIAARVAPGGWLMLSGLLTSQVEAVADTYRESFGLTIASIRRSQHDPEWSSATLQRSRDA